MAKRRHVVRKVVRKQGVRRPAVKPAPTPPPLNQVPLPAAPPPRGPIRCFFLEETDRVALYLRRYVPHGDAKCPQVYGYHNATTRIEDADAIWGEVREGRERAALNFRPEVIPHEDPRWPAQCGCGYVFQETDQWQLHQDLLYRRVDTGEVMALRDVPPGGMWYSDWMLSPGSNRWRGPDGRSLTVRVPSSYSTGHADWVIDAVANNCTRPDDLDHKCWCRHGNPPNITVDKVGNTCAAGGGSILVPGYHGMLQEGYLREC
jgi:hypothetical protein